MSLKPCLQCGNSCKILPVQLGDIFTLTYLRICSLECMIIITYDFLYEIGEHRNFRDSLYDKQDNEDAIESKKFIYEVTEDTLKNMKEHFEANPNLLSTPIPKEIANIFASNPSILSNSAEIIRWVRPTKEDKIKWQSNYVANLKDKLKHAVQELEDLESE